MIPNKTHISIEKGSFTPVLSSGNIATKRYLGISKQRYIKLLVIKTQTVYFKKNGGQS